jgi:hypothetical protein
VKYVEWIPLSQELHMRAAAREAAIRVEEKAALIPIHRRGPALVAVF